MTKLRPQISVRNIVIICGLTLDNLLCTFPMIGREIQTNRRPMAETHYTSYWWLHEIPIGRRWRPLPLPVEHASVDAPSTYRWTTRRLARENRANYKFTVSSKLPIGLKCPGFKQSQPTRFEQEKYLVGSRYTTSQ